MRHLVLPMSLALAGAAGLGLFLYSRRKHKATSSVAQRSAVTGPRDVLAFGDSITVGGKYAAELQRHLPAGSRVVAHGWGGRGVRVISAEALPILAQSTPTDVVILAGVNDLGSFRNADRIIGMLAPFYDAVRARGARVVGVQVLPWRGFVYRRQDVYKGREEEILAEQRKLNAWIAANADATVSATELSRDGDPHGELILSGDGLHPNGEGQKILGRAIFTQAFGG